MRVAPARERGYPQRIWLGALADARNSWDGQEIRGLGSSEFLDLNHTSKSVLLVSLMIATFAFESSIGELQNRKTSLIPEFQAQDIRVPRKLAVEKLGPRVSHCSSRRFA